MSEPPNSNIAPPGYYMLFLVNKAGTPSLASWVKVSGPAAPIANVELHPERVPTPRYVFQRKHVPNRPCRCVRRCMFTRNNPFRWRRLYGRQPVQVTPREPQPGSRQTRPERSASDCRPDPRGCPFVPLTLASRLVTL